MLDDPQGARAGGPWLSGALGFTDGVCSCILDAARTVKCTGSGVLTAQLADGSSPPWQAHECPADGLEGVHALDLRCAIEGDRRVRCWDQMYVASAEGPGHDANARSGIVPGLTDVVGITSGASHACALTGTGEVWCWGRDDLGQVSGHATEVGVWPPRRLGPAPG